MRVLCVLALATFSASSLSAAEAQGEAAGLAIEVHARAVAPGEPLRIEVFSPEELASLEGTLGEREIDFRRASGSDERWQGWAMIGLDEPAGALAIEVAGRTTAGERMQGTRAITVLARKFPEERLSVESRYVEPPADVAARIAEESRLLAAIYARRVEGPPLAPFLAPVPGEPTSIFGSRRIYNGVPRSPHPGLDLRAASGTPVRASGPGEVVLARDLYYSGGTVIVDHGGGLFTLYAHLSRIDAKEGQHIGAGTEIGRSGATGRVTGPHLHWGAKIGERPFDPRALLDPVLFP